MPSRSGNHTKNILLFILFSPCYASPSFTCTKTTNVFYYHKTLCGVFVRKFSSFLPAFSVSDMRGKCNRIADDDERLENYFFSFLFLFFFFFFFSFPPFSERAQSKRSVERREKGKEEKKEKKNRKPNKTDQNKLSSFTESYSFFH